MTRAVIEAHPNLFAGVTTEGLAAVIVSFIKGCAVQSMIEPGLDTAEFLQSSRESFGAGAEVALTLTRGKSSDRQRVLSAKTAVESVVGRGIGRSRLDNSSHTDLSEQRLQKNGPEALMNTQRPDSKATPEADSRSRSRSYSDTDLAMPSFARFRRSLRRSAVFVVPTVGAGRG